MKLNVCCVSLWILVIWSEQASGHLPLGAIIKDTITAVSRVRENIRDRLYNRDEPLTAGEALNQVKDAIVEDYVAHRDQRSYKICNYLKQGRMYRGECPPDPSQNYGGGGGESQYGGGQSGYQTGALHYEASQPQTKPVLRIVIHPDKPSDAGYGQGAAQVTRTVIIRHGGTGQNNHQSGYNEQSNGGYNNQESGYANNQQSGYNQESNYGNNNQQSGYGNNQQSGYNQQPGYANNQQSGYGNNNQQQQTNVHHGQSSNYEAHPGFEEEEDEEDIVPGGHRKRKKGRNPHASCQTTEGLPGLCMPSAYCYAQYTNLEDYRNNICQIGNDPTLPSGKGICCPKHRDRVGDAFDLPIRVPTPLKPSTKVQFISLDDINKAAQKAQMFIHEPGSMQSLHQAFFGEFDPVQFQLTKGGFISLITTVIIKKSFKLSNVEARDGLYKYSIENTDLEQYCIKEPTCVQSKYRTVDGSCNNLQRPLWAKSNTAFERLLPPAYDDGLHEPRTKSVADGSTLPSARIVSVMCGTSQNVPDPKHTLMLMQWGQFIDHDLTLAASTRAATGQGLACCNENNQRAVNHHACFPISIPDNDPFYSRFNQKCMHLVRNSPSPRSGCSLGHREQMNTLSHVLDASQVYGSTPERNRLLRTFRDGKLRTSSMHNTEFLPYDPTNHTEDCAISELEQRRFKCFLSGDVRVNEQAGLTMIHNLLIREHNRVAAILASMHPNRRKWTDEIIYQEARRIVAAEIQHITYNEWLPIILGAKVMKHFDILPKPFGYTNDYNPRINPNILNGFATAAYRFHSLVQGTFLLMDNNGQITHRFDLHHLFNNPKTMYLPNAFDHYLNGFITEPTQSWDKFFSEKITNHLFEEPNTGFGMDLIALNVQRGRDHGLPGYNQYRRLCGLQPMTSFADVGRLMQPGSQDPLSRVYKHVDDIDLFIGGAHEEPLEGALVGPTFACIVGEQARRLKKGDRFWYENGELPHSFKKKQLNEIRKASLASLICDNADNIGQVQPLAFLRPVGWNQKVPCSQIARMNLGFWKNERLWN